MGAGSRDDPCRTTGEVRALTLDAGGHISTINAPASPLARQRAKRLRRVFFARQ